MFRRELRDYRFFLASRVASMLGHQITSVVIGWQVFSLTGRAMDLGYVGLAQFLPAVALSLVTGPIIDRVDRRRVLMLCYAVEVACTLCLFALTRAGNRALWPIYAVLVVFGTARAFSGPSSQALAPNLVSRALLPRAVAWSSTAWQLSVIAGPALGGAVYGALGPAAAYGASMVLLTGAGLATAFVRGGGPSAHTAADGAAPTESKFAKLFAGLRYVFRERAILGTLSLDLFAVLLGGAVALLPMFAASLGGGPLGLGLLRSAPAVGASATALFLSFFPLQRRAGRRMLAAVGVFGLATIAFGLSKSFPLSLACLVVLGGADMVSVVVRRTLLQVRVPDAMRGVDHPRRADVV